MAQSWDRQVEREARRAEQARRDWDRQVEWEACRAEQAKRDNLWRADQQRCAAADKTDREVQELLDREDAARASIKQLVEKTEIDAAGVKWFWCRKTRWWWWLAKNGTWQSKPLKKIEAALHCKSGVPQHVALRGVAIAPIKAQSDAVSDSGVSSVSTAPTLTWPKSKEKVVVLKQRPSARETPLVAAAVAAPAALVPAPGPTPDPDPAPAPSSAARTKHSSSTKLETQSLKRMVATICGELELDNSLTMAQVIAEANHQVGMPAEGTLIEQATSLLREIMP